jgi:hypothetical protein
MLGCTFVVATVIGSPLDQLTGAGRVAVGEVRCGWLPPIMMLMPPILLFMVAVSWWPPGDLLSHETLVWEAFLPTVGPAIIDIVHLE